MWYIYAMRCILIILDGLGDRGHECFDGKTPLQAAKTPNMDYLASIGMNGLYHSSFQGIPISSEIAHFLMFGYEVEEFPGRGFIEAVGEGLNVNDKDVVLLCRLCSVQEKDKRLLLIRGCPEINEEEAIQLKESINSFKYKGIQFNLFHSKKIHGFLLLRGNVSQLITDSDPIYEDEFLMKVLSVNKNRAAQVSKKTASALNSYLRWCYQTLSVHNINQQRLSANLLPVNALVTQRAGRKKKLVPFEERWGLRGLSISSGAIYWGLCSELGMQIKKVKDSGNVEEDLKDRLTIAKEATDYDFIHVHTKMPDEAGHTKNPWYKKDVIEAIDRAMHIAVHKIVPDEEVLLVVTADHSTASSGIMIHTGETVPLSMVGKYVRRDNVCEFNEISSACGGLGIVRGKEIMYLILNFLDKAKMQGLMDTPIDQPYYPGRYKSLEI